ncbi:MAG TPA: serine--tRNA ligase, partial [Myxococcota bacterium]|nr:serine--tRNA ligase [Myxococcota bacterium]
MLTLSYIRGHADAVRKAILDKGVRLDLDHLLGLDARLAALKTEQQGLQAERNALSRQFKGATPEQQAALRARSTEMGDRIAAIQPEYDSVQAELDELMWWVPNVPGDDVPIGPDADHNVVVRTWGEQPAFDFPVQDHVALLAQRGWADFERVAKVSGSRSFSLKGAMVRVEMAIHQMVWDKMEREGFTLITVGDLVKESALLGTGHFPAGREDAYRLEADDLYLAGTAEVVLTGLHAGEILDAAQLPILYAGYSPCFRREAGSAGRDVRGLLRVHQFTKTEQYVICKDDPEESARWHARLLAISEELLQDLELPYQVIECCTGDMGMGKVRMNDVETWMPSLGKYRETHSCSTLHAWQATRANIRYRDEDGRVRFVHTLNNTAAATPRLLAPLLENHQQADGSVRVPAKLRPYLGGHAHA